MEIENQTPQGQKIYGQANSLKGDSTKYSVCINADTQDLAHGGGGDNLPCSIYGRSYPL